MKRINFFSLCRSGHHAVIFWLINNLGGCEEEVYLQKYSNPSSGLLYYNNIGVYNPTFPENYTWLITNTEDREFVSGEDNIVIVRDFYNLLASRYKKYGALLGLREKDYITNLQELIGSWKQHAKTFLDFPTKGISYNAWLKSKTYRDSVAARFSVPNEIDAIDYVPNMGGGSSFVGVQKEKDIESYLHRYKQIELPESIATEVNRDAELASLNTKLFFA
jgi:hypothetical protein